MLARPGPLSLCPEARQGFIFCACPRWPVWASVPEHAAKGWKATQRASRKCAGSPCHEASSGCRPLSGEQPQPSQIRRDRGTRPCWVRKANGLSPSLPEPANTRWHRQTLCQTSGASEGHPGARVLGSLTRAPSKRLGSRALRAFPPSALGALPTATWVSSLGRGACSPGPGQGSRPSHRTATPSLTRSHEKRPCQPGRNRADAAQNRNGRWTLPTASRTQAGEPHSCSLVEQGDSGDRGTRTQRLPEAGLGPAAFQGCTGPPIVPV